MKKILIVSDTYYPKVDGIMRFLDEVVPRIKDNFEITMLVPDFGISKFNEIRLKVSKLIKLSGYPSIKFLSNLGKIKDAIKNCDTVFIQGPALASVLAMYYGKKYKKTVIYFVHIIIWELYEKNLPWLLQKLVVPIIKKFTLKLYNLCDLLVVPYRSLRRDLENAGITVRKEVARLGVDFNNFQPADKDTAKARFGIDKSYTVVGYIGRISNEKNVQTLIEAVKRLQDRYKIMLLIVGSGTRKLMKTIKVSKNTIHPGFQKNVVPYYQAMDIFVMPSLTETTSLATLEAMACGIPVVSTKVGFLKEYVQKDYNGLLFPKGNVYTLVLQLEKMIRSRKSREEMGMNARKTAMNFSWDKTAARIKEILERY